MLLNWVRKVLLAAVCSVLFAGASVAQSLEQQEYPPDQQVQVIRVAWTFGQLM